MQKKEWSEFPKPKVKRAKYLYFGNEVRYPEETKGYFIDANEFLDSRFLDRDQFEYIIRLQETEREFDE